MACIACWGLSLVSDVCCKLKCMITPWQGCVANAPLWSCLESRGCLHFEASVVFGRKAKSAQGLFVVGPDLVLLFHVVFSRCFGTMTTCGVNVCLGLCGQC